MTPIFALVATILLAQHFLMLTLVIGILRKSLCCGQTQHDRCESGGLFSPELEIDAPRAHIDFEIFEFFTPRLMAVQVTVEDFEC